MKTDAQNVDSYLETLEPRRREALAAVRGLVREVVPTAEESMKYGMPTYSHGEHVVCAFASQKQYMSLYMDFDLVKEHRAELAGLNVGKSCIRFTRLEKLPLDTVRQILVETVAKQAA